MIIQLKKPFASNSVVDPYDVRQIKKALNRLGYYLPDTQTGITGVVDTHVFNALKTFQAAQNLPATGIVKPDDETLNALNEAVATNPEGKYVWRTVGDAKIRTLHKELDGAIRFYSESPDPGEDFNCRCWAEPFSLNTRNPIIVGDITQEVISPTPERSRKWKTRDFIRHYYKGKGLTVSLSEAGLLRDVIEHAKIEIFPKVEKQIKTRLKSTSAGSFRDDFKNRYNFIFVEFILGESSVSGVIKGQINNNKKYLTLQGTIEYQFYDEFTDPLSIRENITNGSSNMEEADSLTEIGGTAYKITGDWKTKFVGLFEIVG